MLGSVRGGMVRRSVAGGFFCVVVVLATNAPAWAQTYTGVTPPKLANGAVPTVVVQPAQARSLHVTSAPVTRVVNAPVGGLAFTGADVVGLVALAGILIVIGLVMTRHPRTRSTS